jgi:two-component system, OmpR family, response regulator
MRLLIVEDDPHVNRQVATALSDAGYVVESAHDGEQGLFLGETSEFDAIILDLGLPGLGGLEILRKWRARRRTSPILILTARDSWWDKVAVIDAGADDYLAKPFHMAELLARIRALIRRGAGRGDAVLKCGPLKFDTRTGDVTLEGVSIVLTTFERRLLQYLMHRAGHIVERTEIIEHIYSQDLDRDSNTVEVFVGRLRRKVGPDLIETVRGQGYRMRADSAAGSH